MFTDFDIFKREQKSEKERLQYYMDELLKNKDAEPDEDLSLIEEVKQNNKLEDEYLIDEVDDISDESDIISGEIVALSEEITNLSAKLLDTANDRYLNDYNAAVAKDKENYINLFGSDEDKEKLKAEKDAVLEKERLETEAHEEVLKNKKLELLALEEREKKAKELAEQMLIEERALELKLIRDIEIEQKLKEYSYQLNLYNENIKSDMDYIKVIEDLGVLSKDAYSDNDMKVFEELNDNTLKHINDCQVFIESKSSKKPNENSELELIVDYLNKLESINKNIEKHRVENESFYTRLVKFENTSYPLPIAIKINKSFKKMMSYIFDYLETEVVDDEYSKTLDFDKNFLLVHSKDEIDDSYYFDIKSDYVAGVLVKIIEIKYSDDTNGGLFSDVEKNKLTKESLSDFILSNTLEELYFRVISRQWQPFEYEGTKYVGLKELLDVEFADLKVKENLIKLEI